MSRGKTKQKGDTMIEFNHEIQTSTTMIDSNVYTGTYEESSVDNFYSIDFNGENSWW